jgi:hypothetical protein
VTQKYAPEALARQQKARSQVAEEKVVKMRAEKDRRRRH